MSKVRYKLIVAVSDDGYIGKPDGNLPFKLKTDLARFKELTTGHPLIVGRKTFDSLPFVLPGRDQYVISRSLERFFNSCRAKNCSSGPGTRVQYLDSIEAIQSMLMRGATASDCDYSIIYIIGGADVYRQALEYLDVDGIELTRVHTTFPEADESWAKFELPDGWVEIDSTRYEASDMDEHPFTFISYTKAN